MTEDNFTIRKASPADLPRIHGIYAAARQFMRDHGNFSQWDGEDAPEHLLPGDIEAGNLYVLEENGVIHAAFAFIIGADPCYAVSRAPGRQTPRTPPSTASQATVRSTTS